MSIQEAKPGVGRREFLQTGVLGSLALVMHRTEGLSADPHTVVQDFALEEITVPQLQDMMKSGTATARSLTEQYLGRIEEVDRNGPKLNSVIETNPDALVIAVALDKERKAKGPRGPLHGIPVLIKDNIDTADKMKTTAGSLALVNSKPKDDSFVAQQLRAAGAIILGKTNLSEWANFRSSRSSSGWSGRGGQTRNPYALDRNPCGSSSGSGAAVSASLCAIAIGTETDGSVVCPSSINGVVGIKPTVGLISRTGIIPISHSQDTAGPMARTVTDAAILLGALTGVDKNDTATHADNRKSFTDYTKFLDLNGLKGARIGVARKHFGFNPAVDAIMERAIDTMKDHGATIVDPADLPTHGQFRGSEFEVLLYEFKADLNLYLARLGPEAPYHSLKELIEFNEKNKDKEMPYFGQETFIRAEEKGPLTEQAYLDALEKNHRLAGTEGIDAVMNDSALDALIAPTGGPAWLTDHVCGDHFGGGSSSAAAVSGYPNITVPAGYVFGLPVGISFFGKAWTESKLLRIAYAFEQATTYRHAPKFLPTANLRIM